jgi:ATP synthase protein I
MSPDQRSVGWIRYSGIGIEMAGATAGFALIGYWLDGRFGTSPWGLLIGLFVGLVGGLFNLVRQSLDAVRDAGREDAETEKKE